MADPRDPRAAIDAISAEIRQVARGAPVAVAFSGGLDSSVVGALARDALGPGAVLLVTVNMGQYAYRRGNEIVLEMAEQLGLRQRCLLGAARQHEVQRNGPACNRCTREIKLGMVAAAAPGRLVLTGSNRSDTWGKIGVKINAGIYSPLFEMDKPEIRLVADQLGLRVPRIGEHWVREGCKLKHLLKPLVNPAYHGAAVAQANEALLEVLASAGFEADLANVKIVGPLRRNIGLVNVRPALPARIAAGVMAALGDVSSLDEVRLVEGPLLLRIRSGPALSGDANGRHWVEHGRLAPDFAHPIEADWVPSRDGRLHTFHVLDALPA